MEGQVVESGQKEEPGADEEAKMSKKKRKMLKRLSVAELKQLVVRPDVVEVCLSISPSVRLSSCIYP